MSSNNSSGAEFLCMVQDCTANPLASRGNPMRHTENQHSPLISWVKMPCDKVLKSNPYSNRRHSMGYSNVLCKGYEGLGEPFLAPDDYKKDLVQLIVNARGFKNPQDAVLSCLSADSYARFLHHELAIPGTNNLATFTQVPLQLATENPHCWHKANRYIDDWR
ncbi:hypothetical protein CSHISOI_08886 [Colletotrichum shisoi]|uniref:Uncharacterized protein n=1 Tax=Colletotrichum shisoi TaxID=2078593 RepID=A0A5Q4BI09_9PEZI|nr:hypothetical protein CSHISOI_08886 [Colletotrichum shisoi]